MHVNVYYSDYEMTVRGILNMTVGRGAAQHMLTTLGTMISEHYIALQDPQECANAMLSKYGYSH